MERKGIYRRDSLKDGVRWDADGASDMWFEIEDSDAITEGDPVKYKELAGYENKRSWVEQNKISVHPSDIFEHGLDQDHADLKAEAGEDWEKGTIT